MECFFTLLVIGGIVGVVAYSSKQRGEARQAWTVAARSLGLVAVPGGAFSNPGIRGTLHGFRVSVDVVTRGGGKSRQTFTRYRVLYPPLHLGLRLTKEVAVFTSLSKVFGGQDIEVGEKKFDDQVLVKGKDDERVRAFLTPTRQATIRRFLAHHQRAVVEDGHATFETRGLETNAIKLQSGLRAIHQFAMDLQGEGVERDEAPGTAPELTEAATAAGAPVPIALETREDKRRRRETERRERIARRLENAASAHGNDDSPRSADDVPTSGDADALTGEPQAVAVPPDTPPTEPTVAREPEPARETEPDPEPEPVTPPDVSIQTRICTRLFGDDLRIPDVKALFEENYGGTEVHWTGRLKNARHMYSDTVFGDAPGTRAEIVIASVSAGMFGARDVVAIVHLPESAEETLRSQVGNDVSFSGHLTSLDPFMREIYVAGGTLGT